MEHNQKYHLSIQPKDSKHEKFPHVPLSPALNFTLGTGMLDCNAFIWTLSSRPDSNSFEKQNVSGILHSFMFEFDVDQEENAKPALKKVAQGIYWNQTGQVTKDDAILNELVTIKLLDVPEEQQQHNEIEGESLFSTLGEWHVFRTNSWQSQGQVNLTITSTGDRKKTFHCNLAQRALSYLE